MEKAIGSKINLDNLNSDISFAYFDAICDLIGTQEVQKLKECSQHMSTSRFQHSLNVSYYSFLIARKLRLDAYSAARAGLLHDLYYYDWKTDEDRPMEGNHAKIHPIIALENAKQITPINSTMNDAILHHMWPLKTSRPKTNIGWLIQGVDKYCATIEFISQCLHKVAHSKNLIAYCTIFAFIFTK